jgi:hypothetical protein
MEHRYETNKDGEQELGELGILKLKEEKKKYQRSRSC